jgi:hypothetical protein
MEIHTLEDDMSDLVAVVFGDETTAFEMRAVIDLIPAVREVYQGGHYVSIDSIGR